MQAWDKTNVPLQGKCKWNEIAEACTNLSLSCDDQNNANLGCYSRDYLFQAW